MMERPRMMYLMGLARSMGKPFFEVLAWSEDEIMMQMAYDKTHDDEFQAKCEREKILALSPEERVRRDMAALAK